jgi:lipoprotein NlpD
MHKQNYSSVYMYNGDTLIKFKDIVKIGQKIAFIKRTDDSAVVLHFEIRYRGKSVNPLFYLYKKKY